MDWNWFFSSLAQSAAAIVGIFGAFIITKILSNQAAFSEKRSRMKELLALGRKAADSAGGLYFDWYNRHTSSRELEKIERLLGESVEANAEVIYAKLNYSPFLPRADAIAAIEHVLEERERQIKAERQATQAHLERFGFSDATAFARPLVDRISSPLNLQLGPELQKEREAIEAVLRDVRHHIRLISNFLDSIAGNPESSLAITWALGLVTALFLVGVIYPLSFMPVPAANWVPELSISAFFDILFSLRGGLLLVVSLIFISVLAMFLIMNVRMKYKPKDVEELSAFTFLAAYSKYFAVMEENEKHRGGEES